MSFKIVNDANTQLELLFSSAGTLLVPVYSGNPTSTSSGNLYYDSSDEVLKVSDDSGNWVNVGGGSYTLPDSLQSIADLTTFANQMLYTVNTDSYATTTLTPAGRSFLSLSSVNQQQQALELVPGTNVQAYSPALASLVSISTAENKIPYSSSSSYASASVDDWVLTNVFPLVSATAARTLLDAVEAGTLANLRTIPVVSAANAITESGVSIDVSNNISGLNNATVGGDLTLTGNLDSITPFQRTQISNMNTNPVSSSQWGYISNMNQNIASSSTPTFYGIICASGVNMSSNKIINLTTPTSSNDAANKSYVDSVAGGAGITPLESCDLATTTHLNAAYSSGAGTLTSSPSTTTLTIDSVSVVASDGQRILVKNQLDNTENGIYTRTADVSGNWVLTKTSDFTTLPIIKGTYTLITAGTVNIGSGWILSQEVNVGSLAVIWVQLFSPIQLTPGNGLTSSGNTWSVDATARFTFSGNKLELSTVSTTYGGTGLILDSGDTNQVLVTNGTNPLSVSKAAPSGDFLGTTDTQTLTNKTLIASSNTITASSIFSNNKLNTVNLSEAANPSAGQVLTATSSTGASWSTPTTFTNPTRTLFVYSNASNVSPNYTTLGAALADTFATTASATTPCTILIYPGRYTESNPLTVPQFCTITSLAANQLNVVIRASTANPIINLPGNTRLVGLIFDGNVGDGSTFATNGIVCTGSAQDTINNCTVRNCSGIGILCQGSGTQYSKIVGVNNVSALITTVPVIMSIGMSCTQGGIFFGDQLNISGFLVGTTAVITTALKSADKFSFVDVSNVSISSVGDAIVCGGAAGTDTQTEYPIMRISTLRCDLYTGKGIYGLQKCVFRLANAFINTNSGAAYTNQQSIYLDNPTLPSEPNFLVGFWTNAREDKMELLGGAGTTNPPVIRGSNLSEVPNWVTNQFAGRVSIGSPVFPSELAVGNGSSFSSGELVFEYNATSGISTDYTTEAIYEPDSAFDVFPNTATDSAFYVGSLSLITGLLIGLDTAIVLSSGSIDTVLAWEFWNGTTWTALPFMITLAAATYENKGTQSFGVGTTLATNTQYNYRFGDMSTWASTTASGASITLPAGVSDVSRYYVRARLLAGATAITTQPVANLVRVMGNSTKINTDGFLEYFGAARPVRQENIPSGMWTSSGTAGETAPTSIRLVATTWATSTIASNRTNCVFANNTTTTLCFIWNMPNEIDTSFPIKAILNYSRGSAGGTAGAAISWQIDYINTVDGSVIGDPNGSVSTAGYSSGVVSTASSSTSRGQSKTEITLPFTGFSTNGVTWFKITRFGSADAFSGDVYLLNINLEYTEWCNGTYRV